MRLPTRHSVAEQQSIKTRASTVYEKLKSDILHGVLAPEQKLKIEDISNRYKTGANPIREALNRLSAEGLVSRTDQRGFRVAPLRWEELESLTETRCFIAAKALEDSIRNRTEEWENALVLILHKMSKTDRFLDKEQHIPNPDWESIHREFHRALLANSPSRWLREFSEMLNNESDRFRHVAARRNSSKRDYHGEHAIIFKAAISGDMELARKLLIEHYRQTCAFAEREGKTTKKVK